MSFDEPTVAMLTRWTARLSVTLYLLWLFRQGLLRWRKAYDAVAARRQGNFFVLFAGGHFVHLAFVFLLAYVTGSANVGGRGGWLQAGLTGGIIYLGIGVMMLAHLNLVPAAEKIRQMRSVEFAVALLAWIGFIVAYGGRAANDSTYAPLALLLALGFLLYIASLRIPQPATIRGVQADSLELKTES